MDSAGPPGPSRSRSCGLCGKQATLNCGACKTVFYCNKEHQTSHWKSHRASCTYYKKVQEPSKQSYLVATRKIPKGAIILSSKAEVTGPNGAEPVCMGCLRPLVYDVMSYQCPGCGWPVCGVDCERAPMHQPECKAMQKAGYRLDEKELWKEWRPIFPITPGIWILVLRVLLTNNSKKLFQRYRKDNHEVLNRSLYDRISNFGIDYIRNVLKLNQFEPDIIRNATYMVLKGSLPVNTLLDSHAIFELRHGAGVHISDVININHSCLPNVNLISTLENPQTVHVVASTDILAGEKLHALRRPTAIFSPTWERQFHMNVTGNLIFIRCECQRCTDPTELGLHIGSFSCRKCRAMVVPANPGNGLRFWWCFKCLYIMSESECLKVITNLTAALISASKQKNEADQLVRFIETHSGPKGILHPKHFMIYRAKEKYCDLIFKGSSAKGAAYQFVPAALTRFYAYTNDLMSRNNDLNQEWGFEYFRSKLVCGRNIIHQWVEHNMSKAEAQENLMGLFQVATETSVNLQQKPVNRNVRIWSLNLIAEILMHCKRLETAD